MAPPKTHRDLTIARSVTKSGLVVQLVQSDANGHRTSNLGGLTRSDIASPRTMSAVGHKQTSVSGAEMSAKGQLRTLDARFEMKEAAKLEWPLVQS